LTADEPKAAMLHTYNAVWYWFNLL